MVRGRGCSFPQVSRIVGTPATCGGADASRPGNESTRPLSDFLCTGGTPGRLFGGILGITN